MYININNKELMMMWLWGGIYVLLNRKLFYIERKYLMIDK